MATDLFSVISDPTRRALLLQLHQGECSVGELVDAVGVSQPTVSKHLKVLRDAGLAQTRVQGQRRFYTLHAEPLHEIGEFVLQLLPEPSADEGHTGDTPASGSEVARLEADAHHSRKAHGMGRTVEQVTERAQEFFDRFSKQRFGRKSK